MTDRPRRTPSQLRNMLEVRVRRLSQSYDVHQRRQALQEIRELAAEGLAALGTADE